MTSLFLAISIFANLWIYKVFNQSLIFGFTLVIATILLVVSKKGNRLMILLFLCFIFLFFLYISSTPKKSLTQLSNDDKRIEAIRMNAHPPVYFSVGDKIVWIPTAWWMEGRTETRILYRLTGNLFTVLNPNLFFFANHPRERSGIPEFEKFPYILLPVFLYGVYLQIKNKLDIKLLFLLFISLIICSVLGDVNPLGPFILFPFIAITINYGLGELYKHLKNITKYHYAIICFGLIITFITLLQLVLYERY